MAASDSLLNHHGSQPPTAAMRRNKHWECRGTNGKSCGYMVPVGVAQCMACGHVPPPHISQKAKGKNDNAPAVNAKHARSADRQRPEVPPTRNERRSASRASKRLAKLEEEHPKLLEEIAKLKADASAKPASATTIDAAGGSKAAKKDAPNGSNSAGSAAQPNEQQSEADTELAKAHEQIKLLKSIPEAARPFCREFDAQLQAAQAQLQAAQAAKRAAHPIKQQFENAQAYQARTKKRFDDHVAKADATQQQMQDLQQKLAEQRAAALEAEKAHNDAVAQTAALGAQYAAEVSETSPAAAPAVAALDPRDSALVRDLLKLVPQDSLKDACNSHGIPTDDVEVRTVALLARLETPQPPREPATVTTMGAHRPAGTATAAAAMAVEASNARSTHLEEELATVKAQMREFIQLYSDASVEGEAEGQHAHAAKRKKLESAFALCAAA